jgi:starch-binding outer membrane protein, SusD/RagB family
MKNTYIRIFTLSLFVWSVTACSLNEAPSDGILSDAIPTSPLTLTAATAGNYSKALSQDFIRNLFYMTELPGDNVSLSGTTSDALFYSYNYGHLTNQANSYEIWQRCYSIIEGANHLIPVIDEKKSPEYSQLKGENIYLRAWSHFILATLFGKPYTLLGANPSNDLGVPLVLTYDATAKPKRNTLKETYDAVIADLIQAAALMQSDKSSIYASKEVAYALLSRVYLYSGNNAKAIEYANLVINSGRYSLANTEEYKKYFTILPENNPETIFAIKFAQKDDLGYGSIGSMYNNDGGYGELYASRTYMKLLNKYPKDLRHSFVKVQFGATTSDTIKRNGVPKIFVYKFSNQGALPSLASPAIIRLSEIYLIRAEAQAKSGNNDLAIEDVNLIRSRAGLSGTELYTVADLKGHATVLDVVLEERQLELAFEGFRPLDLFRNNKTMERNYPGVHPKVNGKQTILSTNPRVIHLIPEKEMLLNPNLQPNL